MKELSTWHWFIFGAEKLNPTHTKKKGENVQLFKGVARTMDYSQETFNQKIYLTWKNPRSALASALWIIVQSALRMRRKQVINPWPSWEVGFNRHICLDWYPWQSPYGFYYGFQVFVSTSQSPISFTFLEEISFKLTLFFQAASFFLGGRWWNTWMVPINLGLKFRWMTKHTVECCGGITLRTFNSDPMWSWISDGKKQHFLRTCVK